MHQARDFVASCYRLSHVLGSALPCFAPLWSGEKRERLDGPWAVHRAHRTSRRREARQASGESEALHDPVEGVTSSVGSQPIVPD